MAAEVPFALYPGDAMQGVINYSSTEGRKFWYKATVKITEELYDANPEGLYGFVKNMENHARKFGWM